MKTKIYNYLFSAVLIGIAMMLTACVAKDDNVAAAGDPDTIEDFDIPEQAPTTAGTDNRRAGCAHRWYYLCV